MKPKVLFIMHMPPPVHGAAMMGQYIHDSKLINDEFECSYINPSLSGSVASVGKVNFSKIMAMFKNILSIVKSVVREKPALCYYTPTSDGWGIYRDLLVVSLLKLLGRKVIFHMHNKGVKCYSENHAMARFAYKRIFKNVKVILLAETLYVDVKKYVPRENVYICPNGIPETLAEKPVASRHNDAPHLLFLSNLLVEKGVLVLLDALKILKDRGCQFVCDFVGGETVEINASSFQIEVDRRGLNGLAIYHGRKYGEEKRHVYEETDIFVFPTFYHNECFPLVLLEAMEYKLPVVTTNEGGIPDVVNDGENGFIVEKRNPLSLADCIAVLINDKCLREKMGEDGYRKFKEHFTLKHFEENLVEILNSETKMK